MIRTQRVESLIHDFMKYHEQGYSILEIAKVFRVDFSTVYNHLQEIADINSVSRESLLEKPTSQHLSTRILSNSKVKVDPTALEKEFSVLLTDIDKLLASINNILEIKENN